jgi:hypothetical protein
MTKPTYIKGNPYAVIYEWMLLDTSLSSNSIRLFALLDRYVGANVSAWPGRKTLAAKLELTVKTIDRCLKELEDARSPIDGKPALEKTRRHRDDGSYTSNLYTLYPHTTPSDTYDPTLETDESLPSDTGVPTLATQESLGGDTDVPTGSNPNQLTPETEPQLPITPPTASEEVLGLVDVLRSHLDDNGLPQFEATKAQLNGLRIMLKEEDLEVVTDVLNWACQDTFWHAVILTTLTFKKHYATLKSRFKNDKLTKIRDWINSPEEDSAW